MENLPLNNSKKHESLERYNCFYYYEDDVISARELLKQRMRERFSKERASIRIAMRVLIDECFNITKEE